MRACVWAGAAVALLALAAAAEARRSDPDFEFDDDADLSEAGAEEARARRPRRYVYDPHNALCRSLVCKKREVCLLRETFTAFCATKKDILRKGDIIVSLGGAGGGRGGGSGSGGGGGEEDDVFYDGAARDALDLDDAAPRDRTQDRCVGCGASSGARAQFLCGSDNRTYSSLCRLDLHNCVRRPAPPVALACRGFCPCAAPAPAPARRPLRARRPTRLRARSDEWRKRKAEASHNEVLPERPSRRLSQGSGSDKCALDRMADRLLDWFSVLMEEARAAPPPPAGFPGGCKAEVRWMFAHLDTDGDGLLSAANLYSLRHDERERCLRPFLASCGGGGGAGLSRAAWCGCLRRAARGCAALARAARARGGGWAPVCDARGYYAPRQCHAQLAVCWCVDAHGQELPGSRAKGEPACPGEGAAAPEGAPDDDEDGGGGSGDGELHY